jgi:hypothetical protein
MKTRQIKTGVGLEVTLWYVAIVLMAVRLIPWLWPVQGFAIFAGMVAFLTGVTSSYLYLSEKHGRNWQGGILPLALAGWGLSLILHLPASH